MVLLYFRSKNKKIFQKEIKDFLISVYNVDKFLLDELIKYQDYAVLDPTRKYPVEINFKLNIHDVIHKNLKLEKKGNTLKFNAKNYNGDLFEWGKKTLWWGRRVAACKTKIEYTEERSEMCS